MISKLTATCPVGAVLTSPGTWHNKKGEAGETSYRFKTYRTEACKTCALKSQCTKLPKRIVQRSEYHYQLISNLVAGFTLLSRFLSISQSTSLTNTVTQRTNVFFAREWLYYNGLIAAL